MDRNTQLLHFLEFEQQSHSYIEPQPHVDVIRDRLFDVVRTEKPEVIVKVGLGRGDLLIELAKESNAYIVVVDQSYNNIADFISQNKENDALDSIHFIVGNFTSLPVDYYAANLLICIDTLNILESSIVVDEFRRVLDFGALLFLASVVTNNEDDGIYDDFMRLLLPLHTDYYIEDDLKTFLDLNQLSFVKGHYKTIPLDLDKRIDYFVMFAKLDRQVIENYVNSNKEEFERLYNFSNNKLDIPYFMGVFKRRKPDPVNVDIYDKK